MPKVSVIVPNYNHQDFLRKRLDSVYNQSFQDFDVLLLDDASTDNSVEILNEYAQDARTNLLRNKQNSGSPFKQWNKGLKHVSGDYIWIAESDDYADCAFLERMVAALDDHPSAGIAYCQSWLVPRERVDYAPVTTESSHEMFADYMRWTQGYFNTGHDELARYLAFKNTVPNASGVLIRRSVLGDDIRAPESMRLAGDWMFWTLILLRSDIVFVPEPMNYFREPHTGSQRSRTRQQALELMEGLEIYRFIRDRIEIDRKSRKKILHFQVKTWAFLSRRRDLTKTTNKRIYAKFLKVHDDFVPQRFLLILMPFMFYYVADPLRKIASFMIFFKRFRRTRHRLAEWLVRKNRHP